MPDEYWLSMLDELFTTILESAKELDNTLPQDGYQKISAIIFDAELGKKIVCDMRKERERWNGTDKIEG